MRDQLLLKVPVPRNLAIVAFLPPIVFVVGLVMRLGSPQGGSDLPHFLMLVGGISTFTVIWQIRKVVMDSAITPEGIRYLGQRLFWNRIESVRVDSFPVFGKVILLVVQPALHAFALPSAEADDADELASEKDPRTGEEPFWTYERRQEIIDASLYLENWTEVVQRENIAAFGEPVRFSRQQLREYVELMDGLIYLRLSNNPKQIETIRQFLRERIPTVLIEPPAST